MKDVRPTSGRVISALFSILGERVEGVKFLDLFAGTGRVGVEALRRGASECVFVEGVKSRADEIRKIVCAESRPPCQGGIKGGAFLGGIKGGSFSATPPSCGHLPLTQVRQESCCIVLSLEVRRGVSWLVKRDMKFGVIFADPPYNSGWCETLPAIQNLGGLFAEGALMVIEHSSRENLTLSVNPHNLEITSTRDYGESCLTFLERGR